MSEYFSGNPIRLDTSRSKYHVSPRWTGSWNVGTLVPIFCTTSILPGDTFKMRISSAVRTTTPITAIMDDMDMSIECYFVPHHLIMSRQYMSPSISDSNRSWAAFIGAQDANLNMPLPGDVNLPTVQIASATASYKVGGLADCFGFARPSSADKPVNFLKFGAYYAVWNEYFRDPNTMTPVTYSIGSNGAEFYSNDAGCDGTYPYVLSRFPLAPTCRYHGYFGSALPWPQRNTDTVKLPIGTTAPVLIGGNTNVNSGAALKYHLDGVIDPSQSYDFALGDTLAAGATSGTLHPMNTSGLLSTRSVDGLNLFTDLSQATAASVNTFRFAVQLQRWYEQLARSGNREGEITYGMFGVRGNDEGLKRPEYLGGKRIPIIQSQIPVTGNSTVSSATSLSLGSVGAFSLTNDSDFYFTKSFTTWGTLIVVMTCRTRESFSNGIDREDLRTDRFSFFWPQFANLGEQPVFNEEVFVTGNASTDKTVFGYQEAWAEYRHFNDHVTGLIRPSVSGGLGYMTYANDFAFAPTLKGYLNAEGQQSNVDRTLQVGSATSGLTFYGQFQFDIDMVRPMPLYSVPGLVDHH